MFFMLNPVAPPLKFTAMSEADKEKSVQAGNHLCLQCELSDPTAEVAWFKDGAPLLPQSGVDILSDGTIRTLSIHSAELSHSGMYRCETLDDAVQFTVGVKGDVHTIYRRYYDTLTVLQWQLTADGVLLSWLTPNRRHAVHVSTALVCSNPIHKVSSSC